MNSKDFNENNADLRQSRLKRLCFRFLSLRGSPRQIALGFALGVFVGMSPYMMFHTITAVIIASLFKWNKLSAAAGVFITNPLTAPFIYPATFWAGSRFVGVEKQYRMPESMTPEAIWNLLTRVPELFYVLTIGGIIAGIPLGVLSYFIMYRIIILYRTRKTALTETGPTPCPEAKQFGGQA